MAYVIITVVIVLALLIAGGLITLPNLVDVINFVTPQKSNVDSVHYAGFYIDGHDLAHVVSIVLLVMFFVVLVYGAYKHWMWSNDQQAQIDACNRIQKEIDAKWQRAVNDRK